MSEPSNEYLFVHVIKKPKLALGGKGPGGLGAALQQLQGAEIEAKKAQDSFETHVTVNCPENIKVQAEEFVNFQSFCR